MGVLLTTTLDEKWVQATERRLGTTAEFPNEEAAWRRVDELGLKPYSPQGPRDPRITFGEVAAHYVKWELPDDQTNATIEKPQATITRCKHYLSRWVLPKWKRERALAVRPFGIGRRSKQIEREHQLETTTLDEIRKVMNLVYRHGQRHGILPLTGEGNPMSFVRLSGDDRSAPVSGAACPARFQRQFRYKHQCCFVYQKEAADSSSVLRSRFSVSKCL